MTFDVFQTQLARCPHDALHGGLQSHCVLLGRTARARHACGGRRTWVPQAAGMFSSEKAEKEVAAHFAMFNRKGSGASEAGDGQGERGAHSNGRARDRCAARSTLSRITGPGQCCSRSRMRRQALCGAASTACRCLRSTQTCRRTARCGERSKRPSALQHRSAGSCRGWLCDKCCCVQALTEEEELCNPAERACKVNQSCHRSGGCSGDGLWVPSCARVKQRPGQGAGYARASEAQLYQRHMLHRCQCTSGSASATPAAALALCGRRRGAGERAAPQESALPASA